MPLNQQRIAALAIALGSAHMSAVLAAEARPDISARFLQRVDVRSSGGETTLFGPVREIELRVTIFNDGDANQTIVLKGRFFEQIAWRLIRADGSAVPLQASWSSLAECHGPGFPLSCELAEDKLLAPTVAVEAGVTLTLANGDFEFGQYRLVADLEPAREQLRDMDAHRWPGKMTSPRSFPLIIRGPANRSEQAMQHRVLGGREFTRGNYRTALGYYEQWAEAQPGNPMALNAVAETLFNLKRFAEALSVFRRADALTSASGDSLVPRSIATVLFALNRGSEAEAYLRHRYPHSPEIAAQLLIEARNRADLARHQQ